MDFLPQPRLPNARYCNTTTAGQPRLLRFPLLFIFVFHSAFSRQNSCLFFEFRSAARLIHTLNTVELHPIGCICRIPQSKFNPKQNPPMYLACRKNPN
jgi:hypothetical protein